MEEPSPMPCVLFSFACLRTALNCSAVLVRGRVVCGVSAVAEPSKSCALYSFSCLRTALHCSVVLCCISFCALQRIRRCHFLPLPAVRAGMNRGVACLFCHVGQAPSIPSRPDLSHSVRHLPVSSHPTRPIPSRPIPSHPIPSRPVPSRPILCRATSRKNVDDRFRRARPPGPRRLRPDHLLHTLRRRQPPPQAHRGGGSVSQGG